MKTRFMRKAIAVTGVATGALLFAGTAAQAATSEGNSLDQVDLDVVEGQNLTQTAFEIAHRVPTEEVGGLPVPVDAIPGLNAVVPDQDVPAQVSPDKQPGSNKKGGNTPAAPPASSPVDDLLGGLPIPGGLGGLPVPLPL